MSRGKNIISLVKILTFALVAILVVLAVNEVLKPKYYYTEKWPTQSTFADFYELEKDSVDVLFMGSSHAVASFNPVVLYDSYGITSYNLGSEQQSPLITYYWLREALKYQSPKVLILDTYCFHQYKDGYVYNGMNCWEGAVRKPMDNMRFSLMKVEAAMNIARYDSTQSALSFTLKNIRYHTRWQSLVENDYTMSSMLEHGGVKGFTAIGGSGSSSFSGFTTAAAAKAGEEEMVDVAKEYVDKIVELCEEEGIQLILVNIPYGESTLRYNSNKAYAEAHGVPYYDFNEKTLFTTIHYNSSEDLLGHPNYKGAEKITAYLGKLLTEEYGLEKSAEDVSFDRAREVYESKVENIVLTETKGVVQYFERLNNPKYTLILYDNDPYSKFQCSLVQNGLESLGFTKTTKDCEPGDHYLAIKEGDTITETFYTGDVNIKGSIRNGAVLYSYVIDTTKMLETSHTYSFTVDGTACGQSGTGLHIIVYDNEQKKIIEKVKIDRSTVSATLSRY